MYNYIRGKLVEKTPAYAVVDVGGIGYELRTSLNTFSAIKTEEECKLYTYLYVKEDVQMLYGFQNEAEKHAFLQLISISGIGPSTALMVLSSLSVAELAEAIGTENVSLIQSVKGIGAKTAKRLILELKDKFAKSIPTDVQSTTAAAGHLQANQQKEEALEALIVLGLPKATAEKALQQVIRKHGDTLTLEEMIKLTLQNR